MTFKESLTTQLESLLDGGANSWTLEGQRFVLSIVSIAGIIFFGVMSPLLIVSGWYLELDSWFLTGIYLANSWLIAALFFIFFKIQHRLSLSIGVWLLSALWILIAASTVAAQRPLPTVTIMTLPAVILMVMRLGAPLVLGLGSAGFSLLVFLYPASPVNFDNANAGVLLDLLFFWGATASIVVLLITAAASVRSKRRELQKNKALNEQLLSNRERALRILATELATSLSDLSETLAVCGYDDSGWTNVKLSAFELSATFERVRALLDQDYQLPNYEAVPTNINHLIYSIERQQRSTFGKREIRFNVDASKLPTQTYVLDPFRLRWLITSMLQFIYESCDDLESLHVSITNDRAPSSELFLPLSIDIQVTTSRAPAESTMKKWQEMLAPAPSTELPSREDYEPIELSSSETHTGHSRLEDVRYFLGEMFANFQVQAQTPKVNVDPAGGLNFKCVVPAEPVTL